MAVYVQVRLTSSYKCDRHLLQVAAAKVVAQHQAEIAAFLQGPAMGAAGR